MGRIRPVQNDTIKQIVIVPGQPSRIHISVSNPLFSPDRWGINIHPIGDKESRGGDFLYRLLDPFGLCREPKAQLCRFEISCPSTGPLTPPPKDVCLKRSPAEKSSGVRS